MSSWAKVVTALLAFVVVLIGLGLLYIYSGAYNIAATDEHTGLVRWALNTTQEQSIHARAGDVTISLPADSAALRRGFQAYTEMCVVCHGAPGQERGWMGQGMNPEPPDLSHAAEEFSAEEVYWIIRHGIKMAGMPALEPTHSEEEILELVAFVEQLPEMTEAEYQAWSEQQRQAQEQVQASEADDGHDHEH
jgi:mono/diheme cytochrome c family protein